MMPRSDLLHMKNIHRMEENTVNGSLSAIDGVKAEVKRDIKRALWMEHCRWNYCTLHIHYTYNISTRRLINILCLHTRSQEAWVHKHPGPRVDWQFKWTNNGGGVICRLCSHHFCLSSAEGDCRCPGWSRCLGLPRVPGMHCSPRVPGIYKKEDDWVMQNVCAKSNSKFLKYYSVLKYKRWMLFCWWFLMIPISFVILKNKQWVIMLTL